MGMTNEEREIALYCLKASSDYHSEVCEECVKYPNCDHMIQDDVTETIIKALEQQPCEDCISREAVIRLAEQYPLIIGSRCSGLIADIKHLPSVTPKAEALKQTRPKGKWKYTGMGWFVVCNCSECGFQIDVDEANNFCPYCGAKMIESEE